MKSILNFFLRTAQFAAVAMLFGIATAHAQSVNVGWNFTDLNATADTGTPVNFTEGNMSIANSFGNVSSPITASSASSGYTGATGGGNIGNAVNNATFSTGTSPYATVTFTPTSGYSLQITKFDFGMRSTATGATSYALYSSVDNYATPIFTGTNTANSAWTLKTNPAFNLSGPINAAVTLRLYTYGGATNAGSGTINTRLDDIAITVAANAVVTPTNPTAVASASALAVQPGNSVLLTVTVTPGTNPASTGLTVTGDLSAIGGSATQTFSGSNNVFTYNATLPSNLSFGSKVLNFSVTDAQNRTATAALTLSVRGNFTIFHVNDTHARVTPHKWIIPKHSTSDGAFEDVGGAAFLAAKMLQLTATTPDSLVIDGGDISEGNPIGDMGGNGTMTQFYAILANKLKAQRGRGMDAVVVGNHDVRDVNYITNLQQLNAPTDPNQTPVPVISINVCAKGTQTPYFNPFTIVTINGTKIGILGYTTQASEVGASLASTLDVVDCDWSSTDSTKIHIADYVNQLRNVQGCDVVVLAAHIGHSALVDPTAPLLKDDGAAKLPEIAVTGHWHTWTDTVWQPAVLNYKTIFTESCSYMKYIGELQVNGAGQYISSTQHVIRDAELTPDSDVQTLITNLKAAYDANAVAAQKPKVDDVIGYTADDLLLDNKMKWWSAEEYPWSGNNTAGQWICDAMRWKAAQLYGQCDLSIEAGGGVRSDIPAGPVTFLQIYETFPWNDDTFCRINMTGQEIVNFLKATNCDAGFSSALEVTAYDGVPTAVKMNGSPIDLNHTYTVCINNYMYAHPPSGWTWSDTNPLYRNDVLCRDGIVDFMRQFTSTDNAYHVGGPRYHLNTEFSGGFRAVVTMMNDNDTKTTFEDAFIRFLDATPETLARRGSAQVPADLVNADGSINPANRLSEHELYRSYLGFKTGALKPGDIVETWGKGSYYGGDPEFVDQEGIYADGVEFKVVGHDDSLAKPTFMPSIAAFWDDAHKNHYVKFLARKAGPDSVTDQNGQTIKTWDVTAYGSKTLPGDVGDFLMITGIPTMESYAIRFRCENAIAAVGVTSFPASSTVSSHVNPLPSGTTDPMLTLTATASAKSGAGTWLLSPVADAQVESGAASSNYGTTANLYLQSSGSGYGNERAWLKFDLSSLPSNASITNATLQVWCWKAATTDLPAELRSGTDDTWTETGITWTNQPTPGSVLGTQTLTAGTINLWYNWDVTSVAQNEFSGNKLVSLVVKPVTEDAATAVTFAFDAKEYGSNAPVLQITTTATGPISTVDHVQYFYRFSTDGSIWGSWTSFATATDAPYTATFSYPSGYGYYEFYSVATDNLGNVETAPLATQSSVHFTAVPAYSTQAIVTLSNLSQTYNGSPRVATATTLPPGLTINITYNGSPTAPVNAGLYNVVATINQLGYTGNATGTLAVARINQTISFGPIAPKTSADAPFALSGSATSGLAVTYTSSNPAVATVSGSTVTIVGHGTTTITADQIGNDNYYSASPVDQMLTVTPAAAPSDSSDIPAMPLWAMGALAIALIAIAARLLKPQRQG